MWTPSLLPPSHNQTCWVLPNNHGKICTWGQMGLLAHACGLGALGSPLFPRTVSQGLAQPRGAVQGPVSGAKERQQQQRFEGLGGVRRWLGLSFPSRGGFAQGLGMGPVSPDAGHMNITGHTASLEPQLPHDPSLPFSTEAPTSPTTPPPQRRQAGLINLGPGVSLCTSFQQDCPRGLETPVCPMQIRALPAPRSAFLTGPQDLALLLLGSNTEQGDRTAEAVPARWGRGLRYLSLSPLGKRRGPSEGPKNLNFQQAFPLDAEMCGLLRG